jgi:DNA-binding HxlR family transcriptional regulator
MTTYGQYCPIARAAELLGDRWTLLILREMVCGSHGFNELARGLPRISRGVLAARLRQLEGNGLVARSHDGYELTEAGAELEPLLIGLGEWAARFGFEDPKPDELDPTLLMWWVRRGVDRSQMPRRRTVIEFRFRSEEQRYWLVVEPEDVPDGVSVCYRDPGFDIDLVVHSDVRTMYRIWLGREELRDAMRADRVRVNGDRRLVRGFPGWLELSPLAAAVRAAV